MTRRDFISAAAMATAGTMLASPTRSNVGGKHIRQIKSVAPIDYSALDYVQDGLVAQFDGIENVGYGVHDDNTSEWYSLTSGHILNVSAARCMGRGFESDTIFAAYRSRYITDPNCLGFLLGPVFQADNTIRFPQLTMELVFCPYGFTSSTYVQHVSLNDSMYSYGISTMSPWSSPRIGFVPSYGGYTQYGKYTLLANIENKMTTIAGVVSPYEDTQISIEYFNGMRSGNEMVGDCIMDSRYSFVLGMMQGMTYSYRLYNRALSDGEIQKKKKIDEVRFGT